MLLQGHEELKKRQESLEVRILGAWEKAQQDSRSLHTIVEKQNERLEEQEKMMRNIQLQMQEVLYLLKPPQPLLLGESPAGTKRTVRTEDSDTGSENSNKNPQKKPSGKKAGK